MTQRQRRSKAKMKRAAVKQLRTEGAAEALVESLEPIMKRAKSLLATRFDSNPAIRAALIARINKAAEKASVVLLHQIAQMIELASE